MRLLPQRAQSLRAHLPEFRVRHSDKDAIIRTNLRLGDRREAVLMLGFLSVDPGVEDIDGDMIVGELAHYVHHARVAYVRAVFLEGKSHDQDTRPLDQDTTFDHSLDKLRGNISAHVVVQAPPSKNDFWMIPDRLRLVREIVWIDADAVTAD